MTRQTITLELDEDTVHSLADLGEPREVLARLARSTAEDLDGPNPFNRGQTNRSLKTERQETDVIISEMSASTPTETAAMEGGSPTTSNPAPVEQVRVTAKKKMLEGRKSTDTNLSSERSQVDDVIMDQREANSKMVEATLEAHDRTERADAAKERAEQRAQELRSVAEFREMFIGVLAHDLQTPLSSIVIACSLMLRRGELHEVDAKTAVRVIATSQRMSRMISQLLDFTRSRLGGDFPIDKTATDLADVCRNVIDEFDAKIELDVRGEVTGTWDRDRIGEALTNLTGNAVDHAASGTTVSVKAYQDGDFVVLEVSNVGPPISRELLPVLFEPFRRATQAGKSAPAKLGLGLYIANQIVLAHKGTLEARSQGGTTTFTIRLPRELPTG